MSNAHAKHVMVDIETLGVVPGSSILSIAAVAFNPHAGSILTEWEASVSLESCAEAGLVEDPETQKWWDKQPAEAKQFPNPRPLLEVTDEFLDWIGLIKPAKYWSQGHFDYPILKAAFAAVDRKAPWAYSALCDTRSAYEAAHIRSGFNRHSIKRIGISHTALADCHHQIACLHASLQ